MQIIIHIFFRLYAYFRKTIFTLPAVSHIPQFEDASTSLAENAASPAGDEDVSVGDGHL